MTAVWVACGVLTLLIVVVKVSSVVAPRLQNRKHAKDPSFAPPLPPVRAIPNNRALIDDRLVGDWEHHDDTAALKARAASHWPQTAQAHGLQYAYLGDDHALDGRVCGSALRVRCKQSSGYVVLGKREWQVIDLDQHAMEMELTWARSWPAGRALPEGLRFEKLPLSPALRLQGATLRDGRVLRVLSEPSRFWIRLYLVPADQRMALESAISLFKRLDAEMYAGWDALGCRPGWAPFGPLERDRPRLRGREDGHALTASLERVQGALRTRVSCYFTAQPFRFVLSHPEHGEGSGVDLRIPLAAGLLHASSSEPEALRALLNTPGVLPAALAVVHAFPGSRITERSVELLADGDRGAGIGDLISDVLEAAQGLDPRTH